MKKLFLVFFLSITANAQLFDDYNGGADLTYNTDGSWVVNANRYEGLTASLSNPEHSYASYDITGSIASWELSNSKENEWIGWMDLNRTSVGGWGANSYSCAMVLVANSSIINSESTNGYAIGFKDDEYLVLFRFSTGISSGSASLPSSSTEIISSTYQYTDSDNGVNLYAKLNSDGKWTVKWKSGTAFTESDAVNPDNYSDGSVTSSSADETYRGTDYKYAGWIYAHSSGASEKAYFDNLGFSQNGALPVELTSFSASTINNQVILNWQTATEVNNYGFDIERKHSTNNFWKNLGFVDGNGNSNSPKYYSFTDNVESTVGKYYYRLKQIDNDGKFEYSGVVTVNFSAPNKFELAQNYPNPFNPSTVISYSIPEDGFVKLSLFNIIGQKVKVMKEGFQSAGSYSFEFNAEGLNSGLYFYKLESGGNTQVRKMLLQK